MSTATETILDTTSTTTKVVKSNALMIFQTTLYALYILLIIVFNSFVITTLCKKGNIHNNTLHLCKLSLATADLLVGVFVIPAFMFGLYYQGEYDVFICKSCHFFLGMSKAATVFGLVLVTVDRYLRDATAIRLTHFQGKTAVCCVWIIAGIYAIRHPIFNDMIYQSINSFKTPFKMCLIGEDYTALNAVFLYIDGVIFFIVPWGIVLFCYLRIIIQLQNKYKIENIKNQSSCRKTITMLIITVVISFVGLAPGHILTMYLSISGNWFSAVPQIMISFAILSFTNSWVRPIIYIIFNPLFCSFLKQFGPTGVNNKSTGDEL